MMGRHAIGAILLLASSTAFATEWVEMGGTDRMRVLFGVDRAARVGDMAVAYFRSDYSPALTSSDAAPYDRNQVLIHVNCADLSMQVIQSTYYLNELVTRSVPVEKADADFILRSTRHHIQRLACDEKS